MWSNICRFHALCSLLCLRHVPKKLTCGQRPTDGWRHRLPEKVKSAAMEFPRGKSQWLTGKRGWYLCLLFQEFRISRLQKELWGRKVGRCQNLGSRNTCATLGLFLTIINQRCWLIRPKLVLESEAKFPKFPIQRHRFIFGKAFEPSLKRNDHI